MGTSLGGCNDTCSPCSLQAVPYSREFKQKYDYFRKKLKKPVSRTSRGCRAHLPAPQGLKEEAELEFDGFLNKKLC